MRMLFCSTAGFGSLHPLIALARAAQSAGHAVAISTSNMQGPTIERLGFRFLSAGDNPRAETMRRYPDLPVPPVDDRSQAKVRRLMFGGVFIEFMLPGLLQACETWRPDVVVRGHLALAPLLAAEKCGIPYATIEEASSGELAGNEAMFKDPLARWREDLGLPPDPDFIAPRRYLWLSPFPASIRHAAAPFGETARRIQPLIFNESVGEPPRWLNDLPRDHPVVHASLGTVLQRPEILRVIVDAFADEPLTLVLATGNPALQETLGELPPNVIAEPFVSHTHLLSRCDALITHAGAGTLITGIMHGLPMVMVPFFGDQPPNAERAAATGCGITLDHNTLTAGDLREATRAILADSRYRESSERVRQETLALPDHHKAVGWLEYVAHNRETPPIDR
jgi:MGT family glycosyltransferase